MNFAGQVIATLSTFNEHKKKKTLSVLVIFGET